MSEVITHDPDAKLDYAIDWTSWLQSGETITTATWTRGPVAVGDLTPMTHSTPSVVAGRAIVWIEGGTTDSLYTFTVHVVTSAAREDDRTLRLFCTER